MNHVENVSTSSMPHIHSVAQAITSRSLCNHVNPVVILLATDTSHDVTNKHFNSILFTRLRMLIDALSL